MFARTFLDVGRCCVNRRHDRAGRRIRLLPGVNRARGELLLFLHVDLNLTADYADQNGLRIKKAGKDEYSGDRKQKSLFLGSCFPD